VDDVERDDLGYSETDMSGADGAEPLQPHRAEAEVKEAGQDTTAEDELDPEGEGAPIEDLALATPPAARRLR
jgi:hypothetical protein